nr:hypothetical protein [Tanacetum cinerariifolium]
TPILAARPKTLTITVAPAVSTRRRKGVVISDPEEELPFDTPAETPQVKDKGKRILIEAPKPMKKKDQIEMDTEVDGLENAKAAQQLEIVKFKARVKKLEKINKVKSSKLRRLKKDEGIELVTDQEKDAEVEERHADKQAEIYNIDLDHSSKVLSMQEDDTEVQKAIEIITTAKLMTEVAAASIPIPAVKPKTLTITAAPVVSTKKRKGVVIRDPEDELPSDTLAETPKVKDKGKGILIEAPKPMKKKDQIEMDAEYARKLQEEIDKEAYKNIGWNVALDHVQSKEPQEKIEKKDEEIIKSINETPTQKAAKRRKLSKEAQEADDLRKRLEIVQDEDDDVFVEASPLAQK